MAGAYAMWRSANPASRTDKGFVPQDRDNLPVPTFPWVTSPLLSLAVTDAGMTVIDTAKGVPIATAVGFPRGEVADMADIAADILASVVAA